MSKLLRSFLLVMPDRQIDLLTRFCRQNHGRLAARMRSTPFEFPSDDEVARMEQAVQAAYGSQQADDS